MEGIASIFIQKEPSVTSTMRHPICPFHSIPKAVNDLAWEMARQWSTGPRPLAVYEIPLNCFQPLASIWWLSPRGVGSFYPHGKFIVKPIHKPPTGFFLGFHVVKGIGLDAARAYRIGPEFILEKDWVWHRFRGDMAAGYVQEAARETSEKSGRDVVFQIRLYEASLLCGGQRPERLNKDLGDEFLWWVCGNAMKLVKSRMKSEASNMLASCASMTDIAFVINQPVFQDWWWVDVQVGLPFDFPQNAAEKERAWSAREIVERVIKPWLAWYR